MEFGQNLTAKHVCKLHFSHNVSTSSIRELNCLNLRYQRIGNSGQCYSVNCHLSKNTTEKRNWSRSNTHAIFLKFNGTENILSASKQNKTTHTHKTGWLLMKRLKRSKLQILCHTNQENRIKYHFSVQAKFSLNT